MFFDTVPNRRSPRAILLHESWREARMTRKRTLANLSQGPAHKVEQLRRVLDEPLVAPDALFTVTRSVPHGHIEAMLQMIRRFELDTVLASKRLVFCSLRVLRQRLIRRIDDEHREQPRRPGVAGVFAHPMMGAGALESRLTGAVDARGLVIDLAPDLARQDVRVDESRAGMVVRGRRAPGG